MVEDETVVVESVRRSLRREHLTVEFAAEAAGALAILEEREYKVVLCDLMLPGSSGFSVLEAIRREHPRTQAIVITGYATREHIIESFRLGAFDSAIIYFKGVVAAYPRSSYASQAVMKLIEAYDKIGYVEEKKEMCQYLWQYYPDEQGAERACPEQFATP